MALDTLQKQGSAIHLGIPFRVWRTEPATVGSGEQQSLLGLCAVPLADSVMPPTNTVAPAVTGTVTTGSTLSCTSGTWTGSPTYAYQWYANSTASTSGGTVIGGATSSNYDLTISELGDYIYCVVTATNGDGSVDEPSNVVGPVTSTPVAPTITTTANHSIGENQTAVTTMAATGDEPITWSIVGGADQALFTIDTNSGALSFLVAPNYESPGDADTNNIYVVQVRATNGAGTANQTKNITITDVDETGRVPQGPVLASAMSPVNPPRAVLRALGLI